MNSLWLLCGFASSKDELTFASPVCFQRSPRLRCRHKCSYKLSNSAWRILRRCARSSAHCHQTGPRKEYTLSELLTGITPEDLHDEVDFAKPQGKKARPLPAPHEAWGWRTKSRASWRGDEPNEKES